MSLVYYVKPFLELGVCKEYCMARKTSENISTRGKKIGGPVQPGTVQVVSETPKNGKTATVAPPVNLEEEIRRRAYELYLQRRATAGGLIGNESQDWLVAEREILSRLNGQDSHA
jgi:Protein of unknown function (DUF2934)